MRLIDADKLRFTNEWLSDESGTAAQFMMVSKADVDAAPTVDAEPVKHGHWWLERNPDGAPYCFHCSVCDPDGHCIGNIVASDYCPDCGAKMDEEVGHEDTVSG